MQPLSQNGASGDPERRPGRTVAAMVLLEAGAEESVRELLAHLTQVTCRGPRVEAIIVDRRVGGAPLDLADVTEVSLPGASRGEAWIAGAQAARVEHVVLLEPGARLRAGWLVQAAEALELDESAWAVVGDIALIEPSGGVFDVAHPAHMGEAPAAGWLEACLWRREALGGMGRSHFHPVELELYQSLRQDGRVRAIGAVAAERALEPYTEDCERVRRQAGLLALRRRGSALAPLELSVIVHGTEGLANIERTLASLSRQLVRPGRFEIVLAADPVDAEAERELARLRLDLPLLHVRSSGSPGAVLDSALAAARAPICLFLRAGSIADHDLVERHLRLHAIGAGGTAPRRAILGGVLRPRHGAELALCRHLSGSLFGVPRRALEPGARVPVELVECSNLSVRRSDLAAAGGFDPTWSEPETCDADFAQRLVECGVETLYTPEARISLANRTGFSELCAAREQLWFERTRLYFRHPQLLRGSELLTLGPEELDAKLEELDGVAMAVEAAAAELATMDVGSLERLGSEFGRVALEAVERLDHLLRNLEERWSLAGTRRGLEQLGFASFAEALEHAERPTAALAGERGARVVAWPDWNDESQLGQLLAGALPLAGVPGGALLLYAEPSDGAAAMLAGVADEVFAHVDQRPTVDLLVGPFELAGWRRLGRELSAVWGTRRAPAQALAALALECLEGTEELDRWCERRESADAGQAGPRAQLVPRAQGPEVSVVVPCFDRPERLRSLLTALAAQDLEPERFEVCIADDASPVPLAESLGDVRWPFALRFTRLESNSGPGMARNGALTAASGEIVVLFDDDALPAPSCLRLHLEAHARVSEPRAIQGDFPLHERHRHHSLAEFCERTGLFSGRPVMKPGLVYGGAVLGATNVSIERSHLIAVGGFRRDFPFTGGEDADLGLRLDRALGVKVLYLPHIVAEHDHELEVRTFARRQRILGWSAYRMAVLHDDPSLAFGGSEPISDALVEGLIADLRGTDTELAQLLEHVERVCADELARRTGPQHTLELQPQLERIAFLEYARGLAAAHRDRLPFEEGPGPALPLPAVPEEPGDDLSRTAYTRLALAHARRLAETEARESLSSGADAGLLVEFEERLGPVEAERLYELARRSTGGAILELGCSGTRASVALGSGAIDGHDLRVYAVQDAVLGDAGARGAFLQTVIETGCQRSVRLLDLPTHQLASAWSEPLAVLVLGPELDADPRLFERYLTQDTVIGVLEGGTPEILDWIEELTSKPGFGERAASGALREFRRA